MKLRSVSLEWEARTPKNLSNWGSAQKAEVEASTAQGARKQFGPHGFAIGPTIVFQLCSTAPMTLTGIGT